MSSFLSPSALTQEALFVVVVVLVVILIRVLGQLSAMQRTITQVQTTGREAQDAARQVQTSTAGYFQQIQATQASTQTAVTMTHQETLRSVQNLQQLQQASQSLMNDLKTQHGTAQTIFADWQQASQALFADWRKDTIVLRQALQTTSQQGTWGEQELRRVVELAGMQKHCDFKAPVVLPNGQKPDMVIYLHDQRHIVVDAKAPSQMYLNAVQCEDDKARAVLLKNYAQRIREMVIELSGREYWKQFQPGPALVVLFLPNEAMLRMAFEYDSHLFDLAAEKGVLLASPMILIALLKAMAYGWSQHDRAHNVEHIIAVSRELHKELVSWLTQWQQVKKAIQKTATEFDHATRDYQNRVLPLITKLGQFDSTWLMQEKAFDLQPIHAPRVEGLPPLEPEKADAREAETLNGEESSDVELTDEQDDADQGVAD
jgi:DNA recombination protein RmuC